MTLYTGVLFFDVPVRTACALIKATLGPRVQQRARANTHAPPLGDATDTAHTAS